MGRIITPKYRVEYRDNALALGWTRPDMVSKIDGRPCYTAAWRGRATPERLEDWRKKTNQSYQEGECNAHIRPRGTIPHVSFARIVRQSDDREMATATMPTFEAM